MEKLLVENMRNSLKNEARQSVLCCPIGGTITITCPDDGRCSWGRREQLDLVANHYPSLPSDTKGAGNHFVDLRGVCLTGEGVIPLSQNNQLNAVKYK